MHYQNLIDKDVELINKRLVAPISIAEWVGLCFCGGFILVFATLVSRGQALPPDFMVYLQAEASNAYYYAYWCNPIFQALSHLPLVWAYIIWNFANLAAVFWARRVFGGNAILVFFSYQILSSFFYGQISGLLAGGLALFWWAAANRKPGWAGLGMLMVLSKYQVGLLLGGVLLWYAQPERKQLAKILAVPAITGFITLAVYPQWPVDILTRIQAFSHQSLGITLWNYIGAWSLLLLIPPLILPLPRKQRFGALYSAMFLGAPYFLQTDILSLLCFQTGWQPALALVSYLFPFWGMKAVHLSILFPMAVYITSLANGLSVANRATQIEATQQTS